MSLALTCDGIIEVDGVPVATLLPTARRLSVTDRINDLFDDAADADEEIALLEAELARLRAKRRRALDRRCQSRRTWAVQKISSNSSNPA